MGRRFSYLVLALALIPLCWLTLFGPKDEEPLRARIVHAVDEQPPAVREKIDHEIERHPEGIDERDVIPFLPDGRLQGALLPRNTELHWALAALSATGFLAAILGLFPRGSARPNQLVVAGAFTGTIGILLLLLFQVIAASGVGGVRVYSGKGAIVLLIIRFIGFSYQAALDSNNGFVESLLGFTCGVGFCEELTKALPLLWVVRARAWDNTRGAWASTLDARALCVLGLASGVGFGVSEGITYSSDYYNGIEGPAMYLVRFVSCVGLHAIWAASAGLVLWRKRDTVQGQIDASFLAPLVSVLLVPMVLHGLYDTLLKQNRATWALAVAAASFAWLAICLERAGGEERAGSPRFEFPT